ncbi:MAG: Nramp family divalent metal transporter [Flavobacteriaceae bacterium]
MFKNIGPGILVAAAFIGPGTITICTLAGVNFGYALLWAMLLSVVATVVLQEMAARLGIVTQKGLTSLLREEIPNRLIRTMVLGIILAAIVIGNTAYEAGNISGATLGLEALFGSGGLAYYPWIIGGLAFALLFIGSYKVLEKTFITLVGLMSLSFVITAILTNASITGILKGLFTPEIPSGSLLTIVALIGTTVVPYNLFLHASLVREKWSSVSDLSKARKDTLFSVMLGGFVSMAVIIAATAIPKDEISNALDMAKSLEPLYGNAASVFMGIGLFAAGITSSITAPLAAAYVVNNCFGWNATMKDPRFRMVWMIVLLIGAGSLSLQIRPIEIIQFAQVANGLLLPLIAVTLLWMINRKELMGINKNALWQNVLSLVIIGIVFLLGIKSIFVVFTD